MRRETDAVVLNVANMPLTRIREAITVVARLDWVAWKTIWMMGDPVGDVRIRNTFPIV